MILYPKKNKRLEFFVDANLCGIWHNPTAPEDVRTTKSRTGYVMMCAG